MTVSSWACLTEVLGKAGAAPGTVALGSVKSNIGHLKAAAGAAGFFKAVMALHEKVLPPSLHFVDPNPNLDWDESPLRVNTELRDWPQPPDGVRRAGVSAFGFGGTNFHAVLEEYVPGRHREQETRRTLLVGAGTRRADHVDGRSGRRARPPLRGALVIGGDDDADVVAQLERVASDAATGWTPPLAAPDPAVAGAAVRVAIDHADAADLAAKAGKALAAFASGAPAMWKMLRAQGVFVGRGAAPKVAFLYTGQGSQYVNMLKGLRASEPIVAETFAEADRIMTPLLGRPLSSYIFIDGDDPAAVGALEQQLLQTEITQPAVLATDLALTRVLNAYGVRPDMVMGHSLGEYGALVAAGALTFDSALEAVSARGHEMASLSMADNGAMAAVFGPLAEIERIVEGVDGNVVIANINSNSQAVIGGATAAVDAAIGALRGGWSQRRTHPGQPRVPHLDRGPGQRAAEGRVAPARRTRTRAADRRQRHRRLLPGWRGHRDDARHAGPPGRVTRAVRAGPAHAVRRRRAGLRRGRPEEGTARLRRGRARREPRRRPRAVHQPPEERRRAVPQRRAVRPVGGRPRLPAGAGRERIGRAGRARHRRRPDPTRERAPEDPHEH